MMNIKQMTDSCYVSEDAAKLLLRVAVGFLVLLHGIYKIQNPAAMDFVAGAFEGAHLPVFLAYLVYVGEVIAPIMVIVGFKTRIGARLIAITLVVAILLVHAKQIFTLAAMGGGSAIELQLMFLVGAIAISALGAGKYSLDAKKQSVASTATM